MKRYPNPWFLVPVLAAAATGALIGRNLARVSCLSTTSAVAESCPGREVTFAVIGFLGAAVGVAIVIVLVIRSMAEWHQHRSGALPEAPGPGCEAEPVEEEERE